MNKHQSENQESISDNKKRVQTSVQSYKPLYYTPKHQQRNNTLPETQGASKILRNAPEHRDFKQTIPNNIPQDKERLYEELFHSKTNCKAKNVENNKLRIKVKTLEDCLFKVGQKSDHDEGNSVSIIINLKNQVKELNEQVYEKNDEIQRIKRNVKLTKIQEIESELKSYQDECMRLKKILSLTLQVNSQKNDESLEQKYLAQIKISDDLCNENKLLKKNINELQQQTKHQTLNIKDLEQQVQNLIKEKTLIKKDLSEVERQLDELKFNDTSRSRRNQNSTEHQLKKELEKKIEEWNQLKTENILKDRKIADVEKKSKEIKNSSTVKLEESEKQKNNYKEKMEKYKQELKELQEKYEQLVFSSRSSGVGRRQTFNSDGEETNKNADSKHTKGVSFSQAARRSTFRRIQAITKDQVSQICTEIRYKLRSQNIRLTEIDMYIFNEEIREEGACSIHFLLNAFQVKPFHMSANDSIKLARYLVEPPGEKEIVYNVTLKNENDVIVKQLTNAIGTYNLIFADDKIAIQHKIRDEIHMRKNDIIQVLRKKKQKANDQLPQNVYPREDFQMSLLQTQLNDEEKDFFMQCIFEITHDFNIVDLEVVWKYWPDKGTPLLLKQNSNNVQQDKKVSELQNSCMKTILDYMEKHDLNLFQVRDIIDDDKSGYVSKSELMTFFKKCEVELKSDEILEVMDHFDQQGDGRISVSDICVVIRDAQKEREQQQYNAMAPKKSTEQLIEIVASYILDHMKKSGQDIFDVYNLIDVDRQGFVTKEAMRKLFRTKLILPMDNHEFNQFFKTFDESGDYMIQFDEFRNLLMPEIDRQKGNKK